MREGEQVPISFKRDADGHMYEAVGTIQKILSGDSCTVYWEYFDTERNFTERYHRVFTEEELYAR